MHRIGRWHDELLRSTATGFGLLLIIVLLAARTQAQPAADRATDTADQIAVKHRQHWAFQKLARREPPRVRDNSRTRTAVDAFILARLNVHGLGFAPDAERYTLIRRAYLDLLGLPPTPEAVAAFLRDDRPEAYERLLDQLLATPHFGERWGRHWLDGAGYVDVIGGDNDAGTIKQGENKWRYRDYVIQACNTDKPFDRFLTEQLAGDELVDWRAAPTFTPALRELLIATGFLRTSADDTDENELNTLDVRHGVLQRTAEVLAGNLLGLTLGCAKCHDHKYEPIPQRDYYRLLALLQPAFNPERWLQPRQRQLPDLAPAEKAILDQHNAELDRTVGELRARLAELRRPYEGRLTEAKLTAIPEPIRADTRMALRTPPDKRNEVQKYLAGKLEPLLKVTPAEVTAALSEPDRATATALEGQIADANRRRHAWGHLQVVYDTGPATPTYLLRRGNHDRPGAEVPPGFLSVLNPVGQLSNPAGLESRPTAMSSGRRLALARWLTDTQTPAGALVLRVRVNRVWQHLFGRGLVATADNLGVSGAQPTHPELLDWLASDFAAHGQRLKPLLKLLMTSTVYRQASSPPAPQIDPDNQLFGRMRLRRLESEALRDAILVVSDQLDRTLGGPPVPVEARPDGSFVVKEQGGAGRRGVYLLARRNYHPTLLGVFDQPNLTTNCTCRTPSAVVLQSLTMLNDRFVLDQAEHLAERITRIAGPGPEHGIDAAFRIVLGRPARATEIAWCAEVLQRHTRHYQNEKLSPEQAGRRALAQLCHTLLNTSEFLYVP